MRKNFMKNVFFILALSAVFWGGFSQSVLAAKKEPTPIAAPSEVTVNEEGQLPERIVRPMIAIDPISLQSEGMVIRLWGIRQAEMSETPLELRALDLLDGLIGNEQVNCKIMSGNLSQLVARCATHTNQDLSLALLINGYAIVDRHQTYNTVFASAYAEAQETARLKGAGVWRFVNEPESKSILPKWMKPYIEVLVPVSLIFGPLLGLSIIAFVMRAWFKRVNERQEDALERARYHEDALQQREAQVLVSTLEGELVENKNRIEAFVLIYGDMLRSLKNPNEAPKYQEIGDTVQKNPTCSRVVFEANVGKLSLLDIKLAGMISKLYTSFPREQTYINLEPETPLETAIKLIEKIVAEAEAFLPPVNQVIQELQKINR